MGDITTKHNGAIKENRLAIQDAADILVEKIENGELQSQDCPLVHRFAPGCYIREIFMPTGARVIGKIHATEHFNILLTGKVTVITAEGSEYIEAPYTFISKSGVQKVVIVHDDCVWQTVHVTESTNVDEIEKEVIVDNYSDLVNDGLISHDKGVLK